MAGVDLYVVWAVELNLNSAVCSLLVRSWLMLKIVFTLSFSPPLLWLNVGFFLVTKAIHVHWRKKISQKKKIKTPIIPPDKDSPDKHIVYVFRITSGPIRKYNCPSLSMGDTLQYPWQMPEIMGSTKLHICYIFPCTYITIIKFNWKLGIVRY